jgi:acyl carrier protein
MGDFYKKGVYHDTIRQINQLVYFNLKHIDILEIPQADQLKVVTDYLCEQAKNIIGADRIDPDRSLVSQGFDSLMGVELRNIIECTAGINVPVSWFRKDESIWQFADRIIDKALKTSLENEPVITDELLSPSILDTLKDVDSMDETQLLEMIRSLEN